MVAAQRITILGLAVAVGAISGCSSGGDTVHEQYSYVDSAGRSCRVTLEKATTDAPVLSTSVTCDGPARECSSESRSCFQLDIAPDTLEILNCPACCRGAASSFLSVDCSPLSCEGDADCVFASARCSDGVCVCPDGSCD